MFLISGNLQISRGLSIHFYEMQLSACAACGGYHAPSLIVDRQMDGSVHSNESLSQPSCHQVGS